MSDTSRDLQEGEIRRLRAEVETLEYEAKRARTIIDAKNEVIVQLRDQVEALLGRSGGW